MNFCNKLYYIDYDDEIIIKTEVTNTYDRRKSIDDKIDEIVTNVITKWSNYLIDKLF